MGPDVVGVVPVVPVPPSLKPENPDGAVVVGAVAELAAPAPVVDANMFPGGAPVDVEGARGAPKLEKRLPVGADGRLKRFVLPPTSPNKLLPVPVVGAPDVGGSCPLTPVPDAAVVVGGGVNMLPAPLPAPAAGGLNMLDGGFPAGVVEKKLLVGLGPCGVVLVLPPSALPAVVVVGCVDEVPL